MFGLTIIELAFHAPGLSPFDLKRPPLADRVDSMRATGLGEPARTGGALWSVPSAECLQERDGSGARARVDASVALLGVGAGPAWRTGAVPDNRTMIRIHAAGLAQHVAQVSSDSGFAATRDGGL